MAPSYEYWGITGISTYNVEYASSFRTNVKIETKKEKVKRIAKEKMYASWNIHNKKTERIVEVIQICKPRHIKYR